MTREEAYAILGLAAGRRRGGDQGGASRPDDEAPPRPGRLDLSRRQDQPRQGNPARLSGGGYAGLTDSAIAMDRRLPRCRRRRGTSRPRLPLSARTRRDHKGQDHGTSAFARRSSRSAGSGTRFLPATKAMPKEMLPVVDKPLIQYAVEEAQAAGIEQFIFVTGRSKTAIEDHFDHSYELENDAARARQGRADHARSTSWMPRARPDRLHPPAGAARASAMPCCARATWSATSPSPCCSPTISSWPTRPASSRWSTAHAKIGGNYRRGRWKCRASTPTATASSTSPRDDGKLVHGQGRGREARAGRRAVDPQHHRPLHPRSPRCSTIWRILERGAGGEIQLTDALAQLIGSNKRPFMGLRFEGKRFDCGDKVGFLEANIAFALARDRTWRRRCKQHPRTNIAECRRSMHRAAWTAAIASIPTILREYDIRGVVGETLHAADARAIGRSFAAVLAESRRQARRRRPRRAAELARARGGAGRGLDRRRHRRRARRPRARRRCSISPPTRSASMAGIMVTGSHNPPNHNGFKMMLGKKSFFGADIQRLGRDRRRRRLSRRARARREDAARCSTPMSRGCSPIIDGGRAAHGRLGCRQRRHRRGAAAARPRSCRAGISCSTRRSTARFPGASSRPDRARRTWCSCRTRWRASGCDLGIAFDGDGDRIGVVDGKGRILWGDQFMVLLAARGDRARSPAPPSSPTSRRARCCSTRSRAWAASR